MSAVIRKKLIYPDLKQTIKKFLKCCLTKHTLIEDKASGQSVIQDLKLIGYTNIKFTKPRLNKVIRFTSAMDLF